MQPRPTRLNRMLCRSRSVIAFHGDLGKSGDTAIEALLPAGDYVLDARMTPGAGDAYTLSSAAGRFSPFDYFARAVESIEKNADFTTGRFWEYERLVSSATVLSGPSQFSTAVESSSL